MRHDIKEELREAAFAIIRITAVAVPVAAIFLGILIVAIKLTGASLCS